MSKKIMILGASILQLPAIQKAKEMGLQVVAVDMNPQAIGFREDGIIREIISTIDISAVVEAAKRNRIDGVMTLASDMPMCTVAVVAKELDLVGITDDTALKATNKVEMRKALFEYGVPVPRFFQVSNRVEYDKAVGCFTVPVIVKPADNSGSRGIYEISDLTDRQAIHDVYKYSKASSRNGDVVVEEYMKGPEVSVETLTVDGACHVIQITDKLTTGAPHFVEMGHSQPTQLDAQMVAEIERVTIAANKAIGITNGPSHTEIIVTDEGPKIVELGARLGGDCITTHLVPLSTGVDIVKCSIQIALGEECDWNAKWAKGSAIRYFESHKGRLITIDGLNEVHAVEGFVEVDVVKKKGQEINNIESSTDRVGFVIAQGDNAMAAIGSCNMALTKIRVVID
ncbi:MAG: ATP-grasp domain-containing protein [Christensenellaceae bacterium]